MITSGTQAMKECTVVAPDKYTIYTIYFYFSATTTVRSEIKFILRMFAVRGIILLLPADSETFYSAQNIYRNSIKFDCKLLSALQLKGLLGSKTVTINLRTEEEAYGCTSGRQSIDRSLY
jgi:hypothetical protein